MGFSYRKSFKAGPIRITASKSGISTSVGVKGARVTRRADGRVQTTLSVPGTGARYTSTSGSKRKAAPARQHVQAAPAVRVPSRKEVEAAWSVSGKAMPTYFPGMREKKARFVAALGYRLAQPGEEAWLIVPVINSKAGRDVLVVTSQRLLLFHSDQVLKGGQIVAVDRAKVEQITTHKRFLSQELMICSGPEVEFCGGIAPKVLQWLRVVTRADPMFRLPA